MISGRGGRWGCSRMFCLLFVCLFWLMHGLTTDRLSELTLPFLDGFVGYFADGAAQQYSIPDRLLSDEAVLLISLASTRLQVSYLDYPLARDGRFIDVSRIP